MCRTWGTRMEISPLASAASPTLGKGKGREKFQPWEPKDAHFEWPPPLSLFLRSHRLALQDQVSPIIRLLENTQPRPRAQWLTASLQTCSPLVLHWAPRPGPWITLNTLYGSLGATISPVTKTGLSLISCTEALMGIRPCSTSFKH